MIILVQPQPGGTESVSQGRGRLAERFPPSGERRFDHGQVFKPDPGLVDFSPQPGYQRTALSHSDQVSRAIQHLELHARVVVNQSAIRMVVMK